MKARLINLGRNNVNEEIHVKDETALKRVISKHVFHEDWTFEQSPREEDERYVVHGMNVIGSAKILEP